MAANMDYTVFMTWLSCWAMAKTISIELLCIRMKHILLESFKLYYFLDTWKIKIENNFYILLLKTKVFSYLLRAKKQNTTTLSPFTISFCHLFSDLLEKKDLCMSGKILGTEMVWLMMIWLMSIYLSNRIFRVPGYWRPYFKYYYSIVKLYIILR